MSLSLCACAQHVTQAVQQSRAAVSALDLIARFGIAYICKNNLKINCCIWMKQCWVFYWLDFHFHGIEEKRLQQKKKKKKPYHLFIYQTLTQRTQPHDMKYSCSCRQWPSARKKKFQNHRQFVHEKIFLLKGLSIDKFTLKQILV